MLNTVKKAKSGTFSGYLPAVAALLVFYLIVYFGFAYYNERYQTFQLSEFSRRSSDMLEMLNGNADVEHFLIRTLTASFKASSDYWVFLDRLRVLRKESGERLT